MSKLHARAGRPCHYLESPSPPRFLSTCRACEWLNTCPAAAGTGEVTVNPAEKRSQPFQGSPNHEPGANQPTPDPSQERNWPAGVAPLRGGAGGGFRGTMRTQHSGKSLELCPLCVAWMMMKSKLLPRLRGRRCLPLRGATSGSWPAGTHARDEYGCFLD